MEDTQEVVVKRQVTNCASSTRLKSKAQKKHGENKDSGSAALSLLRLPYDLLPCLVHVREHWGCFSDRSSVCSKEGIT